jgi:hypothetical protein
LNIIPAYGRSYSTKEEVLSDWIANKDFRVAQGPYINITDFEKYCDPTLDTVTFSYNGLSVTINTGILI